MPGLPRERARGAPRHSLQTLTLGGEKKAVLHEGSWKKFSKWPGVLICLLPKPGRLKTGGESLKTGGEEIVQSGDLQTHQVGEGTLATATGILQVPLLLKFLPSSTLGEAGGCLWAGES